MIYGIGVDLVHIGRMETVLKRWEGRFIERVFTSEEIEFCNKRAFPTPCFALRFAAKEAFSKAMGTGFRYPVTLQCISVVQNRAGKPGFSFHPKLEQLVNSRGIVSHHLTISDEAALACACVVLEAQ